MNIEPPAGKKLTWLVIFETNAAQKHDSWTDAQMTTV